jgi:hypothetical protein
MRRAVKWNLLAKFNPSYPMPQELHRQWARFKLTSSMSWRP